MGTAKEQQGRVRFGAFEADLRTGELTKFGSRIRIQSQPFKVLSVLLERPGELFTREELRQRLWSDGTVVDFDHGLATAINKIREVLNDSAENPRFIETLARRGYRFLAPVSPVDSLPTIETSSAKLPLPAPNTPDTLSPRPATLRKSHRRRYAIACGVFLVCLAALASWIHYAFAFPPVPAHIRQVTWSGHVFPGDISVESFPGIATDGTRIYFGETWGGLFALANSLLADNETHPLSTLTEIAGPSLADISPDGSRLLIRNHLSPEVEQPLWIIPSGGNAALRVQNVLAHDATWMPDGQSILYASGHDLFVTRNDGQGAQKFASLPGRAFWMRWSPDGSKLRLTLLDPQTRTPSLWEVSKDGRSYWRLLPNWNGPSGECCGSWSPDGTFFVFEAEQDGHSNIWARYESGLRALISRHPIQLTDGPMDYRAPIASRESNRLFFVGAHTRSQLFRYETTTHQLFRYLPDLTNAVRAVFSKDGQRVAWISNNDGTLWVSRTDGSQRLQLTPRPLQIYMMAWSPDETKICFMGKDAAHPWKLYVVASTGGSPKMLLAEERSEADPSWSPDGQTIAFGRLPAYMTEDVGEKKILLLNTTTSQASELPGSETMFSPRWSPNGRYLAALSSDQRKLMICDMNTHRWSEVSTTSIDNPTWSSDSRYVYYHSFMEEGLPIYRFGLADHKLERIFEFRDVQLADAADYSFQGLAPDNSPLLSVHLWTADVYSLALNKR